MKVHVLVLAGCVVLLGTVALVRRTAPVPPDLPPPTIEAEVWLEDFLPPAAARDGSVDYTAEAQAALDAAAWRTLVLPPFPVRVSARPGEAFCLRTRLPVRVRGSAPGSALVETEGGVQVLRCEGAEDVLLEDFVVRGAGGHGRALAHGLLQVTGGARIRIRGVSVEDGDADGIVVANARDVWVTGCRVERCSKAGIYLAACEGAVVEGNLVRGVGGHRMADGQVVGAGLQLSSSRDVVCRGNVVQDGTGVGILLNAYVGGAAPEGCVVAGNRVARVANPENPDLSGGIRLANGSGVAATHSLVQGNSVRACSDYGIVVENHAAALVQGNTVAESGRVGILVSAGSGATLLANLVLNSDTAHEPDLGAVHLVNQPQGVVLRANELRNDAAYAPAAGVESARGALPGGAHSLEPQQRWFFAPPTAGLWRRGAVVLNAEPDVGEARGWVCTQGGQPGRWAPFGELLPGR